jgi:hypothetical protein
MAAKKYSAEKLKYFEELIQKELKESIAYLDDINRDQSKGARERTRGLTPTLWSKT